MSSKERKNGNTSPAWNLIDKRCRLGKISNNLERHGDEDVVAFTVPFSECMLSGAECGDLLEDKYFDRSVFDSKKGNTVRCEWLSRVEPLKIVGTFEDAYVILTVSGDRELEFDEVRIKDLELVFSHEHPDTAELVGKLYLRPGLATENLILQEHQNHEVVISISNAKVALKKKGKQADLFEAKSDEESTEEALTHPEQLFEQKPKGRGRRAKRENAEPRAH